MASEPSRSLSKMIDRIEVMREELLSIQRSLEKIEVKTPTESQNKTKKEFLRLQVHKGHSYSPPQGQ
jgi:hypothetical protein